MTAARVGIGHMLFHHAPTHDHPLVPTCPVGEVFTPKTHEEACADKHSIVWRQAMDKEFHGLAKAGTFGAT